MASGIDLGTIYAGVGLRHDDFDRGKQHVEREVIDLEHQMEQSTQRMGEQWDRLGRSMSAAITVPLALIGRQMGNTFAEFEQRMAMTAAVSQATEQQWRSMSEAARELGATTQFTAGQAAEGMTFLAMAGFEVNDILGAMPGVLQLAASAQLDLASAADITTNILTGYGLAVEELARVNDVLVSAMTGANTNLQQLGEAMKYAGPVASAAGLQFEEAAAAVALMGNAGIQASMAGTSLRGAITRLLNPTGQVRDLIRELGLNIYDTNGNLLSMMEIISELERVQISAGDMMALFGQRAGPAMQALVDQGSDALKRFYQRLLESSGLAEQVATAQMDTLRGSILELQSAWEGATLKAMDQVEPSLRALIDAGTRLLTLWNSLPDFFHRGAVAMGAVLAVAGPLTIAVRALVTALAPMAGPLGIVLAVASGVGYLAAAFGGAKQSVEELNAAQLDQARTMREQSSALSSLLDEYEALSGKPDLSAEEHSRLETVMQQIIDIQPTIAAGYDDIGEAIRRNIDPLREYAEALQTQSDVFIEAAAARAAVMTPRLENERERLLTELENWRTIKDSMFDQWASTLQQWAEVQQLHREAERAVIQGVRPEDAFKERDEALRRIFPDRPWQLPGLLYTSLEEMALEAESKLAPVTKRMLEIATQLDVIDAQLAEFAAATHVWERLHEGLDPFAEDQPEWSLTPFTQSLERVTAETEQTLAESIRNENALWQAKIRLVQSGSEQFVNEFGTLQTVVQDYITWLSDAFSDPSAEGELADWFRSEREDAEAEFALWKQQLEDWRVDMVHDAQEAGKSDQWIAENVMAQYDQLLKTETEAHQARMALITQQEQEASNELLTQRAWLADQLERAQKLLNDVTLQGPRAVDILRDGTIDDVWEEVDRLFARYGPMADRLREFVGVEVQDLDDLHGLKERIDNFWRHLVDTGRVTAAEQADVLAHQISMMERGSSEWARLTTEWHRLIQQASDEEIQAQWDAMDAQAALYEEEGYVHQARLLREDIQHQQRLAQLQENDEAYELELQRHTAAVSNIQQESMQEVLDILREASDRINESHDADLQRQLDRITQQAEADVRRMRALGATEDQITQVLQNAQTERAQVEAAWYENRRQALEELNIAILRAQGKFHEAELAQLELARDRDLQRVGDDAEQRLLILQRYEAERADLIKHQTDAEIALLEESTQRLFDLEASTLDQRLAQIDRDQEKREQKARDTIRDEERLAQTLANIQRESDTLREQARLEAHLREQAAVSSHQATLLRIQDAGWKAEKAAAKAALDAALASSPGDPEAARLAREIYDAEIASIDQRIQEAYERAGEVMREASMSSMERDLADIDRRAEEFIKAGREEVEVTEWVTQRKKEIRERYHYEELAAEQRFLAETATLEGRAFDAALARIEATRYSSLAQGVDPRQVEVIANAARIAAMVSEAERVLQESLSDIDLRVRLGELDEAGRIEAYENALDAANTMFEGIQVSARTTAQVEAQVAEMRRQLYDATFQTAKENIERQAEREGWRLDQLADRLENEAKLYDLTEQQKRALEHETWRLRDRQRREDERKEEEHLKALERYNAQYQQYLVDSNQISVREALTRDLEAANERLRIAQESAERLGGLDKEANQRLAEAQLAVNQAELALNRHIRESMEEILDILAQASDRINQAHDADLQRQLASIDRQADAQVQRMRQLGATEDQITQFLRNVQTEREQVEAEWHENRRQALQELNIAILRAQGDFHEAELAQLELARDRDLQSIGDDNEQRLLILQRYEVERTDIIKRQTDAEVALLEESTQRLFDLEASVLDQRLAQIDREQIRREQRARDTIRDELRLAETLANIQRESNALREQVENEWHENRRQALQELNIAILRAQGEFHEAELAQLELARDRDLQRVGDDAEQRLLILERYEAERAALIKRQTDAEVELLEESTQRLFDLEASTLEQRLAQIDREQIKRELRARDTIRDEQRLAETLANIQREYDTLREQATTEWYENRRQTLQELNIAILRAQGKFYEAELAQLELARDRDLQMAGDDTEQRLLILQRYEAERADLIKRQTDTEVALLEESTQRLFDLEASALDQRLAQIDRDQKEREQRARDTIRDEQRLAETLANIQQESATLRERATTEWNENRRQALQELNIAILRAQGEFYEAELAQLELARDRDLQSVGDDIERRLLILERYEAEREALIKRQTDAEEALLEESNQRLFDLEASVLDQRLAQIDREQIRREQSARDTIKDERRLAETLANIQREYDTLREQARLEANLREQAAVSAHHATLLRIQGAGWEAEKAAARAALDAALASAPGDPEAARVAQEIYDAEMARIDQRIKEAYEEAGDRMQEASMSAMERDLADIDRRAEEFRKARRDEAEVTEWVEARKAEIRKRYRYEELAAEQRFQAELATLEGRAFDAELARIEATRYSSLAQGMDPVQVNLIADTARMAAMVSEAERFLQEALTGIDLEVRLGELDEAGRIEAYERALDAANTMFEGIQVSARTTAQVEAQVAEMRRRLYDDGFRQAKENIERQAEREGWRLDRLAQRLDDEAKLYQLTEEQKQALEHETWRLRDRQRREDERLAEERRRAQERYEAELQQYLVESGQITVQEGLRRDLEAARERVRIAEELAQELEGINEEANQQLVEAQLAVSQAEFALKRQELDDDRAFYETKVALGQWEAEERLDQLARLIQREREILGERAELSMAYRQLLMEERQLKQQIAAEDAEDRIRDIRAGEQTIQGLIIQRQELEALYAQHVAGGDESVKALERVQVALREVGDELDKVLGEQLLVRMARRLENVLAGRMDAQDWFMAGMQDVVDDAARSITSQLTPAVAKFVELSVSGAHDFETAWTTAFSEVEITGTDIITILVMELVKLISGYLDAVDKLDEAVKRDREQTQADRERFEALMSAGFAGEFETSTRKHTEQVKYLFGLFRSNVTRTVEITSEETQRLIENLERMLQELQRTGQTAMREAFDAPVGMAGTEFLSNLRRGIYDHVRDGLIQAFMEHQMYTQLMAPLWQAIDEGISAAFSGSSFDPDQFWQVVGPALDQWTSDIGDLEGPADWMQDVLAQLAELLDLPMQVGEQISRGGRRLTNLTGEQRDLFVEMWRPITLEATQAPTRHHDHMTRLDTIIDILVQSLGGGDELQTFLQTEQATMHATTITIEHIVTATLTGPIQGPVNMFVDGEDLEHVVNRILKEHERAGMQGVRSTGG